MIKLDTESTSYVMAILPDDGYVGHVYYGPLLPDDDIRYLLRTDEVPAPSVRKREKCSFLDFFSMEMPGNGTGDFRDGCIEILDENGHSAVELKYGSHRIYNGKPALEGLPATFADDDECMTLELHLVDDIAHIEVVILETVFEGSDAIARSVKVINNGTAPTKLTKIYSTCIDVDDRDFRFLTLHGSWARERCKDISDIGYGISSVGSIRGESSHQEHPFCALVSSDVSQDNGEAYAFNFVYSGNFTAQVEKSQFDSIRMTMGINPRNFTFVLKEKESFQAPEVVMTYSDNGLGKMSRCYHDLFRDHLIRSKYKDIERPILINNWEATYFDFDTDKLISIAKEASKVGIEMFVMDDGWFGHRNNDDSSLGDWKVNEKKLPGGLKRLADEINSLGMKFGIWFEPEMISPDSDLYRAHPDWGIQSKGRGHTYSRNQLVLNLANPDVVAYIKSAIDKILTENAIDYVKWDYNRNITNIGNGDSVLATQMQSHAYMLGLYDLVSYLTEKHSNILFESCSGGGGRNDLGMMRYFPQVWASDNTDAISRLPIQYGSSYLYPTISMGAHVSASPNHQMGRTTPLETRGNVAMMGNLGYELDLTSLPQAEKDVIAAQVAHYKDIRPVVQFGKQYRLINPEAGSNEAAVEFVYEDKVVVTYVRTLSTIETIETTLKLKGLEEEATYQLQGIDQVFSGAELMYAGLTTILPQGDYLSKQYYFVKQ